MQTCIRCRKDAGITLPQNNGRHMQDCEASWHINSVLIQIEPNIRTVFL
jgi:hypothetical protein